VLWFDRRVIFDALRGTHPPVVRDALGPTQLKIVEAKELPDGRLFTRLLHTGTGARSGASVERTTVQILSFEDGMVARTVVFGDLNEGRAAGGL
jgi:hypothetical protein